MGDDRSLKEIADIPLTSMARMYSPGSSVFVGMRTAFLQRTSFASTGTGMGSFPGHAAHLPKLPEPSLRLEVMSALENGLRATLTARMRGHGHGCVSLNAPSELTTS
jgi:hypothetical protein